jgi:hypothetical protein
MKKVVAITNNVLVLTYNVSFQAMTNSSQGTAGPLGKKCTCAGGVKTKNCLTICACNMAAMIEGVPASLKRTYIDFAGLQEANRSDVLQKAAPNTLGKMTRIASEVGNMKMASFYNPGRYSLLKKHAGSFWKTRPFQILVLKHSFDSSGTIFINNHCPHNFSVNSLEKELSKALTAMKLSQAEKQYRIIAVGDFNETFWDRTKGKMKQYSWTPFGGAGIPTKIEVGNFVCSCCMSDGNWDNGHGRIVKGSHDTDFIFDSKAPAHIQFPPNYDPDKLMSDHLPVVAELF